MLSKVARAMLQPLKMSAMNSLRMAPVATMHRHQRLWSSATSSTDQQQQQEEEDFRKHAMTIPTRVDRPNESVETKRARLLYTLNDRLSCSPTNTQVPIAEARHL